MSEEIRVDKSLNDEEIYKTLVPQAEALINSGEPVTTNLANISAALKQSFDKISWAGFYIFNGEKLILGPFQGKVACTVIMPGSGVCGTSFSKNETIIVEDVDKFPGHIACDADSRSEIVVPLLSDGNIFGVLDLDSASYSSFNETDKIYLEKICNIIVSKLNLENYRLT